MGGRLRIRSVPRGAIHDHRSLKVILGADKRGTIGASLLTLLELHLGKDPLPLQYLEHHLSLRTRIPLSLRQTYPAQSRR